MSEEMFLGIMEGIAITIILWIISAVKRRKKFDHIRDMAEEQKEKTQPNKGQETCLSEVNKKKEEGCMPYFWLVFMIFCVAWLLVISIRV